MLYLFERKCGYHNWFSLVTTSRYGMLFTFSIYSPYQVKEGLRNDHHGILNNTIFSRCYYYCYSNWITVVSKVVVQTAVFFCSYM